MEIQDQQSNDVKKQQGKRTRLTIDISPELRRRIKIAAAQRDLSITEYVERILEQAIPEAEPHHIPRRPITKEAIERLMATRDAIFREHGEQMFEDSTEMIRQMREERTRHLEELL